MPPPPQIAEWISKRYPSPKVDPEWLDGCYTWLLSEQNFDPVNDFNKIIEQVEVQLLESDLSDSMLPGTGLPQATATAVQTTLPGPILVEIVSITDIGISAYNLNKTRIVREERLAAGEEEEGEGDMDIEGEGPVPVYPRSMLRCELSDGAMTLRAIEYRAIPELTLGSTPLGFKMLLKNVSVRRGIVFLEPACVILKGHHNSEREATQKAHFARSLRERLGLPEPAEADPPAALVVEQAPAPAPQAQAQAQAPPPPLQNMRSPSPTLPVDDDDFRDLDEDLDEAFKNLDDNFNDQPPPPLRRGPIPNPTPIPSSSSTYFPTASSSTLAPTHTGGPSTDAQQLYRTLALSPVGPTPIIIDSDEEEDEDGEFWNSNQRNAGRRTAPLPARNTSNAKGKAPAPPPPAKNGGDDSSEYGYDDDFDLDPAVLAELDEIEQRAYSGLNGVNSAVSSVIPASIHPKSGSSNHPSGGGNIPPAHPDSSSGLGVGVRDAPVASTSRIDNGTRTGTGGGVSGTSGNATTTHTGSVAPRTQSITRTTTAARTGSVPAAGGSRSRTASRAPSKPPPNPEDVICIDSSSSEDDKENAVPVKKKKKTTRGGAAVTATQGGRATTQGGPRQARVKGEYLGDVIDLSD